MYLKERDKKIRLFVEEYGGITINICANIFFTSSNQKYMLASKRLRILYKNNYLKRYRKDIYSEVVYYLEKPPKDHTVKLLELYSRLYMIGDIIRFEKHCRVRTGGKDRQLDGLIELQIKKDDEAYIFPLIIEIDATHNTSLKRMQEIYESNFFQNEYGVFPYVLIVKRHSWQTVFSTDLFGYKFLNWEMEGLEDVFDN